MNKWIERSIALAEKGEYLDRLHDVYKLPKNEKRELDPKLWTLVEEAYKNKNSAELIKILLTLELFPIKHSFVAFFRKDLSAIDRNPKTVQAIADHIYSMGLEELKKRAEEPKETNRQMGPLFKNFLASENLGLPTMNLSEFKKSSSDAILVSSDEESKNYATEFLGYSREKGLDIVMRIQGRHIIGEAKFLTDFGGHQNAQLDDAFSTLNSVVTDCDKILVLDGVLFLRNDGKMFKSITGKYKNENIISSVLLKEFIAEKLVGK